MTLPRRLQRPISRRAAERAESSLARFTPAPFTLACLAGLVGCEPTTVMVKGPAPPVEEQAVAVCDPGDKRVHRLNRVEYDNTIRDLLGVDARLGEEFPTDDVGYGFDNIADVLSTSPLLVDKLSRAAETAAASALAERRWRERALFEAEALGGTVGAARSDSWILSSNGSISAEVSVAHSGSYTIRIAARQSAAGDEHAKMVLRVDGEDVRTFDVSATTFAEHIHTTELTAGDHTLTVAFTNDFYLPEEGLDRNLTVDFLELKGEGSLGFPETRDRLIPCDAATIGAEACAQEVLTAFLPRAYRRPVAPEEIERAVALVRQAMALGESFDKGIQLAVQAALSSPSFFYRIELDPAPDSEAHPLSGYELANRLSYFLWSSMPDDALFARAESGTLTKPEVLLAETERMLADPKSDALVRSLAGQWLQTRSLAEAQPDPNLYPGFDDDIRAAMTGETARFLEELLLDDGLPITAMMDADFTYADETLAAYYGLPFPDDAETDAEGFTRLSLAGSGRGGLLTQGSFLTATSYALRTSPVRRGKWVLEQLLCMAPAPPPANVVGEIDENDDTATVRERLELHRQNPECAACHVMMDPIGFGLEGFDPSGRPRTTDNGQPIEDSDVFFTGEVFHGSQELSAVIQKMPELQSCVATHFTTYAVGRGLELSEAGDRCTVADVTARAQAMGGSLGDVVRAVVTSRAFTHRRGPEASSNGEEQ